MVRSDPRPAPGSSPRSPSAGLLPKAQLCVQAACCERSIEPCNLQRRRSLPVPVCPAAGAALATVLWKEGVCEGLPGTAYFPHLGGSHVLASVSLPCPCTFLLCLDKSCRSCQPISDHEAFYNPMLMAHNSGDSSIALSTQDPGLTYELPGARPGSYHACFLCSHGVCIWEPALTHWAFLI